jgi:3-hydroxyacyl-[acyl-carrier-protein] dehydratase
MYFSVIDRIIAWEPGGWIRAEKHLHGDECFLPDHFPGTPVMPGVLILEAMVQAGDWLIQSGRREPPGRFCLRALRAVKFVHFVQPGETLVVSVKLVQENADQVELACQAVVDDRVVALARMTLASRDTSTLDQCATNGEVLGVSKASLVSPEMRGEPRGGGLVVRAADGAAADPVAAYRWLWLDRFVEFQTGHSARALKRVPRMRQCYSLGQLFPEQLTAALVLEGLAQTGGLLAFDALAFRKSPIMAKITKAEFCGEPEPGAVLDYTAVLERLDEDVAVVCTASHCSERLHAQAEILFALMGDDRGNSTVDPAVFYTMMCDSGAFDVPPQRRLRPRPEFQWASG